MSNDHAYNTPIPVLENAGTLSGTEENTGRNKAMENNEQREELKFTGRMEEKAA